ncbi:hypothetical protein [Acidithiobacillus concretivorus]|uniref:hypothetical protein n=1 Tax=Acidithiobacillus concretivorus TaxID=3063952 RepID=UPI001C075C04|nr:hypothetical protein [Acidithiobacillus concretivorus]
MDRRQLLKSILSALAIAGYVQADRANASGMGSMMGNMMEGNDHDHEGMRAMMSPENRGPMRTGMELFQVHAEVHRKVTFLPNGIHAVTISAVPHTVALLQAHVTQMYQRLAEDQPFPYPASQSVPVMFAHPTLYQRKLDYLKDGVAVTETSSDPEMIQVIHAHAREITRFVKEGMPAMMRGMMSS